MCEGQSTYSSHLEEKYSLSLAATPSNYLQMFKSHYLQSLEKDSKRGEKAPIVETPRIKGPG